MNEGVAAVHLVHPDGSAWSAVPDGPKVTITLTRGGKTTVREKAFPDARALGRFVTEGAAQMVRVGYAPLDSPLPALRERVRAMRDALVGEAPEALVPRTWALWTSARFARDLEALWKFGGIEPVLAPLADTPRARDALVRACVPTGWPAEPLAFQAGSPLLVPLLRLRATEARLAQLERAAAPSSSEWNAFGGEAPPLPDPDEIVRLDLLALARIGGLELAPELVDGVVGPAEEAWAGLAPRVNAELRRGAGPHGELALRAAEDEAAWGP